MVSKNTNYYYFFKIKNSEGNRGLGEDNYVCGKLNENMASTVALT